MAKEEMIQMNGEIIDCMGNGIFKVKIEGCEHAITARPKGKMAQFNIRILKGDKVDVELSPYDSTKGRITYRHKA